MWKVQRDIKRLVIKLPMCILLILNEGPCGSNEGKEIFDIYFDTICSSTYVEKDNESTKISST